MRGLTFKMHFIQSYSKSVGINAAHDFVNRIRKVMHCGFSKLKIFGKPVRNNPDDYRIKLIGTHYFVCTVISCYKQWVNYRRIHL